LLLGIALVGIGPATLLCGDEALAQKDQQLVRVPEPQLASGIDLFDPTFDVPLTRLRVGAKRKNKGPSHLTRHSTSVSLSLS
jgi:hypothetical protein